MTSKAKLRIHVWSMFTVDGEVDENGKRKVRWAGDAKHAGEPTKENTIENAYVEVLDAQDAPERNVPLARTDKNGHVTVDLSSLADGMYTLRLRPHPTQESTVPAGVALDPPGNIPRMYRPLEVRIRWKNGGLATPPPAVFVKDPLTTNGAVVAWDAESLTLDWKPDYVRAKNIKVRAVKAAKKAAKEPKYKVKTPMSVSLPDQPVWCVVLHRTETAAIGPALNRYLSENVNAHYVIDVDGFVVKMVHEREEASHAGEFAQWGGKRPLNACSVGIEMVNEKGPMTEPQMKSLIVLLKALLKAYDIKKENVVGHCEVSPLKKNPSGKVSNERQECPGREFDWPRLEKENVAATLHTPKVPGMASLLRLYPYFADPEAKPLEEGDNDKVPRYGNQKADAGRFAGTVRQMQVALRVVGYEEAVDEPAARDMPFALPVQGKYDEAMGRVVDRFKVRYLMKRDDEPNKPKLDQKLDRVTVYTIRRAWLGRGLP